MRPLLIPLVLRCGSFGGEVDSREAEIGWYAPIPKSGLAVRATFSPARAWRPAVVARLGRMSGITKRPQCYHPQMIDWSSCPAAERDPARMSGAWVFKGTRVPIAALFENLEDDASVQQFVEWFPGVSLDQARAVLEHAARSPLAVA